MSLVFDEKTHKPVKATRRDAICSIWRVMYAQFLFTLLMAYMGHYNYLPFGITKAGRLGENAAITDYLNPRHLGNCFFFCRECNAGK